MSHNRLARIISIKNPRAFRSSINRFKKNGVTIKEKRGLKIAQKNAKLQLKRKNLSTKERKQFKIISKMKLPPATRKSARGPTLRIIRRRPSIGFV